jgi:transcriptional regulator with XRE-family HTH domain
LNWTQQQLADALGWSSSSVGNLESGKRKVIADDIAPLCRVFGVTFAQLVDRAEPADLEALDL